jgi:anthranilate synthase component 1
MYHPNLAEVKKRLSEGNLIPVYREIMADLETPVSAFLKINRGGPSFLLESVEGGQKLARYSFIGTEPYKTLKVSAADGLSPLPGIQTELSRWELK